MRRILVSLLTAATGALASSGIAAAGTTFFFDGIVTPESSIGDIIIGETQLSMEVSTPSPDIVEFLFINEGDSASSVANIYWDDDDSRLGDVQNELGGPGVSFDEGGAPPVLPGGNEVGFDSDFRIAANNPKPMNGINPGESLLVRFSLAGFEDLLGDEFDIIDEIRTGRLRVGMHVISFPDGGSESFVSRVVIPAPQTIGLGAAGFGLLVTGMRRRWRA